MKKIVPEGAILIPDSASRVFEGQIFDVYQWPQEVFDGATHTFEMLKRPDTVTVIPIVVNQILTIEDEQPHTGSKLSFPGGRVDKTDLSILEAAKREVKEETGYEFASWRLVNVSQPHFKLEWFIYFYVAWDSKKTAEPHLDAGERISIKMLDFDQAKKFVITKAGYLGESTEVFTKVSDVKGLTSLPEFKGHEVER